MCLNVALGIFIHMKPIIEYTDYRKFIQDFYDEKKRTSAFTWREFAKQAGFSSAVYLKYVCEGKKNLSRVAAAPVAQAMGLIGFGSDYFTAMVNYSLAKDDATKKALFEDMCAMAKANKVRVLGEEEFDYYKSWKNSVLRELAPAMPGARPLEMSRACKSYISAFEVSETLNFLQKAGLLQKDENGSFHQTDKSISMGNVDAVPVAARDLQRQMGELALDALQLPLSERDMSGITVGITQNGYERIVKALEEFRRQVVDIVQSDGETEQVYRLNLQFFPLTERVRGGQKNDV